MEIKETDGGWIASWGVNQEQMFSIIRSWRRNFQTPEDKSQAIYEVMCKNNKWGNEQN